MTRLSTWLTSASNRWVCALDGFSMVQRSPDARAGRDQDVHARQTVKRAHTRAHTKLDSRHPQPPTQPIRRRGVYWSVWMDAHDRMFGEIAVRLELLTR